MARISLETFARKERVEGATTIEKGKKGILAHAGMRDVLHANMLHSVLAQLIGVSATFCPLACDAFDRLDTTGPLPRDEFEGNCSRRLGKYPLNRCNRSHPDGKGDQWLWNSSLI